MTFRLVDVHLVTALQAVKLIFFYTLSSRVRQGCRPYSFSCLSLWLVNLRQDKELHSVTLFGKEFKIGQFADETTFFVGIRAW